MPIQLTLQGHRLRVEEVAGGGATSVVYRCRRVSDGLRCALKVARHPRFNARLADEASRLLWAQSSALPELLGAGRLKLRESRPASAELRAIARENASSSGANLDIAPHAGALLLSWVPGKDLRKWALDGKRLDEAAILEVAWAVAFALRDLHAAGVSHGDVKPENISLSESSLGLQVSLLDLGLGGAADATHVSGGTHRYLSPEVLGTVAGGDGRKRDLWALGVVLAELVADPRGELSVEQLKGGLEGSGRVRPLIEALLSTCPGTRPSAEWVEKRAAKALGKLRSTEQVYSERRARIRRAYLRVRKEELVRIAASDSSGPSSLQGVASDWATSAVGQLRAIQELSPTSLAPKPQNERCALEDLNATSRLRFLVDLIGPIAASWPIDEAERDGDMLGRMLRLSELVDPYAFTLAQLGDPNPPAPKGPPLSPVELSLQLWDGIPRQDVLAEAEDYALSDGASPQFVLALARRLRSLGQPGRALLVLGSRTGEMLVAEAAETARRAGDADGALDRIRSLDGTIDDRVRSRCAATEARILLDRGLSEPASRRLQGVRETAGVLEVRSLIELGLGRRAESASALARARVLAVGDEERARIESLRGMLLHAEQKPILAVEAFRSAVEYASRAGAVLEEATYLTGLSAASVDACLVDNALSSSERASALFESLGRPQDAARAALNRVAAFSAVGAATLAASAAELALGLARQVKDETCAAYIHLELSDVLEESREGAEHALFALRLLKDAPASERLMASARAHDHGHEVDIAACDDTARGVASDPAASLDWWGARCRVASRHGELRQAEMLVGELVRLLSSHVAPARRGRALSAGASLALAAQLGDAARRLVAVASTDAQTLIANCPPELRPSVFSRAWIRDISRPSESLLLPEQVADIENLVRALGRELELRPLLVQVLDALVLWTGVERGLLLLAAPGGKLVARVGRNLSRRDLLGHQLTLSHSLSEQALAQGEPIVAVDASGEMGSVHESVHALKLRSVLAVPLIARGQSLGVVYLDDRIRRGAFGPKELAWVRVVGAVAAVAIADAKDRVLLRRSVRRAERAERRSTELLASREAELGQVRVELARTRDQVPIRHKYEGIIGTSQALCDLLKLLDRVVQADVPVLVCGESGTGKELVARAIHRNGARGSGAFVAENCGALPEPLLESTLFGHVKGAFTGASRTRAGLFEVAHEGTLFLDEVAEMSLAMQTKLLRVLQSGEFWPVGAERSRRADVRVIAATHRDIETMVRDGTFRQDLYYRLNVVKLRVPPLRERYGDIPILVTHFLKHYGGGRDIEVSREALELMCRYSWPGNVRQMENELRRAIVLSDSTIDTLQLSEELRREALAAPPLPQGLDLRAHVDGLERQLVAAALERTQGNQTRAAELLGVSRFGLQKMLRRLEIRVSDLPEDPDERSSPRASFVASRGRRRGA